MKTINDKITEAMRKLNDLKEEDPTLFLSAFFRGNPLAINVLAAGRQYPAEVRVTLTFKRELDLLAALSKASQPGWTAHERLTILIKKACSTFYQPVC